MIDTEYVVLVDDKNKVLGTAPKLKTHNANTPLHRGFSVFLFDHRKNLLLQQRSKYKKTFPLIWSNSCCGHPILNETNIAAAKRHLENELGIKDIEVFEVIYDYRYQTEMNGIFENEICPILVCFTDQKPLINKAEVETIKWISWKNFLKQVKDGINNYSLWAREETILLEKNIKFLKLFKEYTK